MTFFFSSRLLENDLTLCIIEAKTFVLLIVTKMPFCIVCYYAAQGWLQKRNRGQAHKRPSEQDVQQGLPAHGPDVAAGPQQNGVHTDGLCRVARHHVQCAPPTRVHVQSGPREHAAGRRFPAVRQGPVLLIAVRFVVSHFAPNHFGFPVCLKGVHDPLVIGAA